MKDSFIRNHPCSFVKCPWFPICPVPAESLVKLPWSQLITCKCFLHSRWNTILLDCGCVHMLTCLMSWYLNLEIMTHKFSIVLTESNLHRNQQDKCKVHWYQRFAFLTLLLALLALLNLQTKAFEDFQVSWPVQFNKKQQNSNSFGVDKAATQGLRSCHCCRIRFLCNLWHRFNIWPLPFTFELGALCPLRSRKLRL